MGEFSATWNWRILIQQTIIFFVCCEVKLMCLHIVEYFFLIFLICLFLPEDMSRFDLSSLIFLGIWVLSIGKFRSFCVTWKVFKKILSLLFLFQLFWCHGKPIILKLWIHSCSRMMEVAPCLPTAPSVYTQVGSAIYILPTSPPPCPRVDLSSGHLQKVLGNVLERASIHFYHWSSFSRFLCFLFTINR